MILLAFVVALVLFLPVITQAMELESDELELLADEVIIDDLNQQIIAIDNVELFKQDLALSADRLEADDKLEEIVASGSINLTRGEEVLQGESLEFDLSDSSGRLTGNPSYSSQDFLLVADEFEVDYQSEVLIASGEVSIEDQKQGLDARADRIEYRLAAGELILTGDVKIERERGVMLAQEVIVDAETRRITASENPRLIIN